MDQLAIADRRQLRRKLGFWRLVSIALILLAGIAAYIYASAGETGAFSRPHIARVNISGIIQDDRELLERLDRIAENNAVKALVVTITSPGGTTYGGEVLFKAIRKVAEKKPVVADIRTLAASAGYMIALAGDRIIAGETSITGSIGVLFQYPQIKTLMDKVGVSLEEIKSSPLKAEPSPFHPPSDDAKAVIQAMIDDSFNWFVDVVADRRKMPRDEARQLADGRIFTGRQALKLKLVDELGGEVEIRAFLNGRKVAKELDIVEWKAPGSSFPFGLGATASGWLKSLGYEAFPLLESLEKIGREKLFLDGLVSVWQVGSD